MTSKLIISNVEYIKKIIQQKLEKLEETVGIYISLNKPHKKIKEELEQEGINTKKTFFIECVTQETQDEETLHIPPYDLEQLLYSIKEFMKEIPGEKYIIIDALSTLLIYNTEEKVASFIKELTETAQNEKIRVIAFSPKTKEEELLNKIFNFFDSVEK